MISLLCDITWLCVQCHTYCKYSQEEPFLQCLLIHTWWKTPVAALSLKNIAQSSVKGPWFVTGPWAHHVNSEWGRTNEAWRFILKSLCMELPVCINTIKCHKSTCKAAALYKHDLQAPQIVCQPPNCSVKTKERLNENFVGNLIGKSGALWIWETIMKNVACIIKFNILQFFWV